MIPRSANHSWGVHNNLAVRALVKSSAELSTLRLPVPFLLALDKDDVGVRVFFNQRLNSLQGVTQATTNLLCCSVTSTLDLA